MMDKRLVLEDQSGNVLRVFHWDGRPVKVLRRGDTQRLELVENLDELNTKKIPYENLGDLNQDLLKKPYLLGHLGQLNFVNEVTQTEKDLQRNEDKDRSWYLTLLFTFVFFFGFMLAIKSLRDGTPKLEEELKQQVVKISKDIQKQMMKVSPQISVFQKAESTVTSKTPSTLKRMGALSVLGSLKSGSQKGGLNLGAAQTSAGPGLGGGTQGSGGVQTSLYAKGVVGAPVGVGGNINGAGGYGTKGKGGGQAGYGSLSLVGSSGATSIPLGAEATVAKGLDRDQIAAVINRNSGQVRFCYEQGLQGNASLNGRVSVAFTIGGNGLVKAADVDSTSLNSKAVEDCIVMRLKSWKFPLPEGGVDVKVSYPFVLRRSGQG